MRRIGQGPFELARTRGERPSVAGEGSAHRRRGGHVEVARRHRPRDPASCSLVAAQHVLVRDARGFQGHRRGHGRVAVAIPADPSGPPESDVLPGGPRHSRQGGEDRPVEQRHGRADLVEGRRRRASNRVGEPQAHHLLREPSELLGARPPRTSRIVEGIEHVADPPEVLDDRPALRLGRVCGQDLRHLDRSLDRAGVRRRAAPPARSSRTR